MLFGCVCVCVNQSSLNQQRARKPTRQRSSQVSKLRKQANSQHEQSTRPCQANRPPHLLPTCQPFTHPTTQEVSCTCSLSRKRIDLVFQFRRPPPPRFSAAQVAGLVLLRGGFGSGGSSGPTALVPGLAATALSVPYLALLSQAPWVRLTP